MRRQLLIAAALVSRSLALIPSAPRTATSPRSFSMATTDAAATAAAADYAPPSKVVICGAGLHGSALAYYLTKMGHKDVTVVEKHSVAAAASGKGGCFLSRDWGSGPTVQLHQESFALHAELAAELGIESYRRIPVLEVPATIGFHRLRAAPIPHTALPIHGLGPAGKTYGRDQGHLSMARWGHCAVRRDG